MFTYEISVTNECNLDCYFCFACNKTEKGCLTLDNFVKGYEMVKKLKDPDEQVFIKMYGGEPLLYKDRVLKYLEYMLDNYRHDNFYIALITNGTLLTEEFVTRVKDLQDRGLNIFFNISMEVCKDVHNKIRCFKESKNGTFDLIIGNIRKMNKILGHRASVQSVMSPEFLMNIDNYIKFIEEHKDLAVFNVVPMFDETFENVDRCLLNNMTKLFDYYIDAYKKHDCYHVGIFQSLRALCGSFNLVNKTYCTAGHRQLSILPNGDLYPCVNFYHNGKTNYKYGNVKDEPIDNYDKYRNFFLNSTTHGSKCVWCQTQFKFGCLGQCIANMSKFDDKLLPWVCDYNKMFGLNSMRLKYELSGNTEFLQEVNKYDTVKVPEFHSEFMKYIKNEMM